MNGEGSPYTKVGIFWDYEVGILADCQIVSGSKKLRRQNRIAPSLGMETDNINLTLTNAQLTAEQIEVCLALMWSVRSGTPCVASDRYFFSR